MSTDRPYVSFAEVKEKVPIPDVLDVLGISDRFTKKPDHLTGACPLPQHQHGPRPNDQQFKINSKDGIWLWHCFGDCQRGGDVVDFVKAMTGLSNQHVRFWFAEHFGKRLTLGRAKSPKATAPTKEARESAAKQTSQASKPASANVSPVLEPLKPLRFRLDLDPTVPYLKQRGVTSETIARYGLGLCKRGTLKGYVAMPVHPWPCEPGANPFGYIGRLPQDEGFTDDRPRYKVPEGFETSRLIYGLREAMEHSDQDSPLIVVEGAFKVFHLVQAGFPAAVSTFTASLSDEQATILAATGRRIVLLFDGNEAGYAGARRAAGRLITRCFVRVTKLPEGVEPDSLSPAALREILPV